MKVMHTLKPGSARSRTGTHGTELSPVRQP
jgi:hypothetical protein